MRSQLLSRIHGIQYIRKTILNASFTGTAEEYTVLDRMFRFKPAIDPRTYHEDNETDDFDGIPEKFVEDVDGEPDPSLRLGKHLMKYGKIHYKHIDRLPEWFQEKQRNICSHRTPAQIRRCLKNWMLENDRDLQVTFRHRKLGWRNSTSDKLPPSAMPYGPEETIAYAHYFMPSRFAVMTRILNEVKTLVPDLGKRTERGIRMLDFGCGPATGLAAATSTWTRSDESHEQAVSKTVSDSIFVTKYVGVDISQSMLDAGKIMAQGITETDSVFWDKTKNVVQSAGSRGDRYDLVVASYSLTELASDPARKAAVQLLYELLDVGGLLVIVEAGNPQGSHTVRTARQYILDLFNQETVSRNEIEVQAPREHRGGEGNRSDDQHVKEGAGGSGVDRDERKRQSRVHQHALAAPAGYSHSQITARVVAPCTHDRPCPLGGGVWCSFSQKVGNANVYCYWCRKE